MNSRHLIFRLFLLFLLFVSWMPADLPATRPVPAGPASSGTCPPPSGAALSSLPSHSHPWATAGAAWIGMAASFRTVLPASSGPDLHGTSFDTAHLQGEFRIARIRYRGGGDWYNDPSALRNLLAFARENLPIPVSTEYDDVDLGDRELHGYPFAFLTGHGTIETSDEEIANLRSWLDQGGFLYIDDDYGLDDSIRTMIGRLYPDQELVELPFDHPVYHQIYSFPEGLPKVHEHDNKPPQGLAIIRDGRMVLFYTLESNLSDGWAHDVHSNPARIVEASLQMGVNLLVYALTTSRGVARGS